MENQNFAAPKANEPLMSKTNPSQDTHGKIPAVAVVDDDDTKQKFLPQTDGDGVHYKKEFGQVEIKQAPKFIGLTQEELQKYADDPFWRKLRLGLFALFWISWIAMFVIAIVLVVTSPKCPPKPPRHWWQKQLCYQAYTRTFKDSDGDGVGDLKGMTEKLSEIKRIHVQTIWPVPVIDSSNFTGYDVTNFTGVDKRLGTLEDFTALVGEAHGKSMYVVIDLPITTMSVESDWFKQSSSRSDGNYANHFYWKTSPTPTENWVHNQKRDQHYFTFGPQKWPVLNWSSKEVQEDMKAVIHTWIDRGVDGFYLGNIHLLGVNPDTGGTDWLTVDKHIQGIRLAVDEFKNKTGSSKEIALFTALDPNQYAQPGVGSLVGPNGLSYIISNELTDVNETCDGKCIRDNLVAILERHSENNETWPVWEIGNPYKDRVTTRLGNNRHRSELLQLLLFMMNGSIITYYGDEIGLRNVNQTTITVPLKNFAMRSPMQWDDSENAGFSNAKTIPIPVNDDYKHNNLKKQLDASSSSAKLYKTMGEWRKEDDTILFGGMEIPPSRGSVVVVKRNAYNPSSMTYYAVLNFGAQVEKVNMKTQFNFTQGASDPIVATMTSNLVGPYKNREQVIVEDVTLQPYSGLVFKYK